MPNIIDTAGKVIGDAQTPAVLERDYSGKTHVLFRAVYREFANPRAGTASTKKRDEVAGGGRKPWRQKGTGRARQGSIRSPQWRHGGVVFGPQPRSYVNDLNKKERKLAFIAALANRFQSGAVSVLDAGDFNLSKTAELAKLLFGSAKEAKKGPATLVVVAHDEANGERIERLANNLARVGVTNTGALDVKDVLRFERLVFTKSAYDAIAASVGRAETTGSRK
jgi:large subunit ribosomal protein L4